jgi:peptide/nickel transport system ATP-binding protein
MIQEIENRATEQTNDKKKPLISIRELKQYFPVRGKRGMFVKANDGITLDIFEGETLGIVGESGCGKSTLGRVLLQLFEQTDGETIFYGRTLESVAPVYAVDIYKNLEKKCIKSKLEMEKLEKLEAEYEALKNEIGDSQDPDQLKRLYAKMNERNETKRKTYKDFLGIVRLVGGFYVSKDFQEVSRVFVEYYRACLSIKSIEMGLKKQHLEVAELEYAGQMDGADERNASKIADLKQRIDSTINGALQKAEDEKAEKYKAVEALRAKYADDEEFKKYEAYRDEGIDLARLKYSEMRHLRKDLQLIFQDPFSSLNPRLTVGQIVSEGPITHSDYKTNNERAQKYVMQVMENCGLASYMIHRYPHQFSGGQRQRIGIARALSVKPRFVVCDEAVSALDVSIQSQIINLLQDLKEKENLTYMFISHDLSVVKYISDRIAVMYLGNIVELSSSAQMFENPLHPYTEALLSAIPTTDIENTKEMIILEGDIPSPVNPPKGCKFNTRCRDCMDICLQVIPEWKEHVPGHFVACHKYNE